MNNLQTCFAISTRFIAWGDGLKHRQLSDLMKLDASSVKSEEKGELIQSSASPRSRTAKTGLMSVSFENEYNCFDPVAQLSIVSDKLETLNNETLQECGVERGELQVFLYYEKENPCDAERDFLTPKRLLVALAKTGIQLRITVMP